MTVETVQTFSIGRESLYLSIPYQAPQGELEILIASLFAEVFNIDPVGAEDDFFDLGGDSLLAVTLSLAISESTGGDFQLSSLVEHSSPRKIAALLQGKTSPKTAASSGQRNRPPIFVVHGQAGLTFPNPEFRRELPEGQRLYMFELPGLRGVGNVCDSVEDIAAHYVGELEQNYEKGPIFLASFCIGALIALEMIAQLAKKGRPVGQLVLLDPNIPKKMPVENADPAGTGLYEKRNRQGTLDKLKTPLRRLFGATLNSRRQKKPPLAEKYRRKIEQKAREGRARYAELHLSTDAQAKLRAACRKYRPVPFVGPVAILTSRERDPLYRDPSYIWNVLLPQRHLYLVMDRHDDILSASTARKMQSVFDAVQLAATG